MNSKVGRKSILLIIDPQRDFHAGGSLAVPGADADSERIAEMILNKGEQISEIFVSLDSHHSLHISHAAFWSEKVQNGGNETKKPSDFSTLSHKEIVEGKYFPVDRSQLQYCKDYTRSLEATNRFQHTIFPEHCLIGSVGHAVVENIHKALNIWSIHHHQNIHYITKGQNCLTEMYSVIEAEVPVSSDPQTGTNFKLLEGLHNSDRLIICGQALSHCVQYTVRDILKHWKKEKKQIFLLQDACSSVNTPDAIRSGEAFLAEMKNTISVCTVAGAFDS